MPYIDALPRDQLVGIGRALDKALKEHRDRVWPCLVQARDAARHEQVLVPLSRLSAPQGYSGASVFIAYWRGAGARRASLPLIVKVGDRSTLEGERHRAARVPPHPGGADARLARPLSLERVSDKWVLISPFASMTTTNDGGTTYEFRIEDLWKRLHDSATYDDLEASLSKTYKLIHQMHGDGRTRPRRRGMKYNKQYLPYLRGIDSSRRTLATSLFGRDRSTRMFERSWTNPLRVMDKLLTEGFRGARGPIHGDLHPKNIVFEDEKDSNPTIIDFGWANADAHVVADYVLMDVNLRAMTLATHVSATAAVQLAEMLDRDADVPGDEAIEVRARLIKKVLWPQVAPFVVDWDREYLVPLFLMSLGLLRYLHNARNQTALLALVLAAGDRIDQRLLSGSTRA